MSSAAGVAAAGFIDAAQSTVYYAPNINWRNEPLRATARERLDLDHHGRQRRQRGGLGRVPFRRRSPVQRHDRCSLSEPESAARSSREDRLFRGGFGAGAEIGHLRVVPDGLPCGCGARGCIEQYGSGRALLRMANAIADVGGIGLALADARARTGELTGDQVGRLIARRRRRCALQALRELGGWLGQACASLAAVLDPQVFVFGGGVAQAGDLLLDPIRDAFLAHLPARGFHPEPSSRPPNSSTTLASSAPPISRESTRLTR